MLKLFYSILMSRILVISLLSVLYFNSIAQDPVDETFNKLSVRSPVVRDTLRSFLVKKNPPYLYTARIKHKEAGFVKKMIRGNYYDMVYAIVMGTYLLICPEYISKWNKKEKYRLESISNQYRETFTKPPVIDNDMNIVNYVGHPYQGGFYYNSVRAQGATVLQSSLFCLGQSVLWEYVWEGGMEQPSIQDLITTPLGGILWGELSHVLTIKMSKNGFRWYEAIVVCIINPAYALNNGFKVRK